MMFIPGFIKIHQLFQNLLKTGMDGHNKHVMVL